MSFKASSSGIRGIWGKDITPETIVRLVSAWLNTADCGSEIVVGRDTRKTSPVIKSIAVSTVNSLGVDVIDLGIVPTPTVVLAVKEKKLKAGLIITASHNPPEWNALKLIGRDTFLDSETVKKIVESREKPQWVSFLEIGRTTYDENFINFHISKVINHINTDEVSKRKFRVVLDPVNGAGTIPAQKLLESLNCQVITIHSDPEKFPERGTEPTPENLKDLSRAVKETNADVGFALDPDADRLAVVDENGNPIGEEFTVALAVMNELEKGLKGNIVVNLSTSALVDFVAKKYGAEVIRSAVGEANVVRKMNEVKGVIGGEGNGGVIYPVINPARDSLVGMALILELMSRKGKPVSEITKEFPKLKMVKLKFEVVQNWKSTVLENFNGRINTEDGIRIDFEDGWVHIRESNTEPVMRLIAESESENWLKEIIKKFQKVLGVKI